MKLRILTLMFGSQKNKLIKDIMVTDRLRKHTNRRSSNRSGLRVRNSYSNNKRQKRRKGGEFDEWSTLSSKDRKNKAVNR